MLLPSIRDLSVHEQCALVLDRETLERQGLAATVSEFRDFEGVL